MGVYQYLSSIWTFLRMKWSILITILCNGCRPGLSWVIWDTVWSLELGRFGEMAVGTHSVGGGGGRGEERDLCYGCKTVIPGEGTSGVTCPHPLAPDMNKWLQEKRFLQSLGATVFKTAVQASFTPELFAIFMEDCLYKLLCYPS